jgi:hypothetical protein
MICYGEREYVGEAYPLHCIPGNEPKGNPLLDYLCIRQHDRLEVIRNML